MPLMFRPSISYTMKRTYNTSCMTSHTHPKCCNYLIVGLNCGTHGARKDTREELLKPKPVIVGFHVKVVFHSNNMPYCIDMYNAHTLCTGDGV